LLKICRKLLQFSYKLALGLKEQIPKGHEKFFMPFVFVFYPTLILVNASIKRTNFSILAIEKTNFIS